MKLKHSKNSLVTRTITVEGGGKAVIAGHIDAVHIHTASDLSATPLNPFATVPPLPTCFVNRPELSEPIIAKLLSSSVTIAITAIAGMFGIGKTMIALGLCHDKRIRARFPDGIIWLHVGKEANVLKEDRIKQVAHALNQNFNVYSEEAYRSLLADKAVLVLLDDVWDSDVVEPFRISSDRSRLIYTSRDRGLAGPLGAENHEIGILDESQARNFLAIWAGIGEELLPEPYASDILTECQGSALALSMIGAALRDQLIQRWRHLLADLKAAKLRKIGLRPSGYGYETLHASIAVSVGSLMPDQKVKYLRLAVTLEDMVLPPALLRSLWGGDERAVDDLICLFVDRSLASRDVDGGIRLHDLQLDYIRGEHPEPTTLALQHRTLLRSFHVLHLHPEQFALQMIGRLIAYQNEPGIAAFLNELDSCAAFPRLRPLLPALEAAATETVRVLEGYSSSVLAVALSSDGRCAVSGSYDKTICVWDLEGKQPPDVLKGHSGLVWAVALSSNGKRVVSGSDDQTVRVWDLESNQPPHVLHGHSGRVTAVALSSDGRCAVSASYDNTVCVWGLEGSQPPRILEGHLGPVGAVALSSDGRCAVSASEDGTMRVWDLEGSQPPYVLEGHSSRVRAIALSSDGKRAVSGSDDRTVRLWDLENKQPLRVLRGHSSLVYAVALSADGKRAVSGSDDETVRVWDLESKHPLRIQEGHTNSIFAVALSSDGRRAVSASSDKTVCVWDLEGGQPPRALEGHVGSVWAVALSSDGTRAVSASEDKTVRVWDLERSQPPCILEGHSGEVWAVAVSANGKRAVTGSYDETVRIWDLEGNQPPRVLECQSSWVRAVALSSDGKRVVSGSYDGTVRAWDVENKQPPRVLEGHSDLVWAVAMSGNGKRAISGSKDGTVRVWDLEGNQPPRVLEGHLGPVRAVALSSDGKRAVSGSEDKTLRVWDVEGKKTLMTFTCDSPIFGCAWVQYRIAIGDAGGRLHVLAWQE